LNTTGYEINFITRCDNIHIGIPGWWKFFKLPAVPLQLSLPTGVGEGDYSCRISEIR
jgi:hypothetical protein